MYHLLTPSWKRDPAPTRDELYERFNRTYFATGMYAMADTYKSWNSAGAFYNASSLYYKKVFQCTKDIPILMMNGDADPQTPYVYTQAQYDNIKGTCSKIKLVKIKYAPHFVIMRSPWKPENDKDSTWCGMHIMLQFLRNSTSDPNSECADKTTPPNLIEPDASTAQLFFGVKDIWEGIVEVRESERTINLYLFIGVVAGTIVISIIIICCLIYYIVQLKDKQGEKDSGYDDLEDDDDDE